MNNKELYKCKPSFSLAERDVQGLDGLAVVLGLRSRSEVVRHLIRAEVRKQKKRLDVFFKEAKRK